MSVSMVSRLGGGASLSVPRLCELGERGAQHLESGAGARAHEDARNPTIRVALDARARGRLRSILFSTRSCGTSPAPISASTGSTAAICSSRTGDERVDHVQQQVGVHRLLERRAERGDQVVRQVADEADRVGEHDRRRPRASHTRRVVVSSVAKSWSAA